MFQLALNHCPLASSISAVLDLPFDVLFPAVTCISSMFVFHSSLKLLPATSTA